MGAPLAGGAPASNSSDEQHVAARNAQSVCPPSAAGGPLGAQPGAGDGAAPADAGRRSGQPGVPAADGPAWGALQAQQVGGRARVRGRGGGGSRRGLLLGWEGYGSESDAAARQRGGRSFVASLPAPNLQEYRCPAAAPPLPRRRRHKSQVGQLLSLPLNDTQMRSLLGTVPSWMTDPSSVNSTERLDWLNTLLAEASGGLGLAAPPAASRCSRCSQQAAFASTLGCMPGCIQACIPACQWLVRAQHFNGKLPA